MSEKIELLLFPPIEKEILQLLLKDYLIELAQYQEENIDPLLDYPYLDNYWLEETRIAYKLVYNNQIAGFALVNSHTLTTKAKGRKSIAEFYIKPSFRRKGLGKIFSFMVLKQFSRTWEIRVLRNNLKAFLFWKAIIGTYTQDNYTLCEQKDALWDGFIFVFEI